MASLCRAAIVGGVVFTLLLAEAMGASSDDPVLRPLHQRIVRQEKGGWVIDYRFEYVGREDLVLNAKEISVDIVGDVSNSREDSKHNHPMKSELAVRGLQAGARDVSVADSIIDLIASPDPEVRCRETLHVDLWDVTESAAISEQTSVRLTPQRIQSGGRLAVQLRLGHEHFVRSYNPLLGARTVRISLGTGDSSVKFADFVRFDEEEFFYAPYEHIEPAPADKRDGAHPLFSADNLFLEIGNIGHECYRFPSVPVRDKSGVTLTIWYYLDSEFDGELSVRISQYYANNGPWKVLHEAAVVYPLVGARDRWIKFDRKIHTAPEANQIAANFTLENGSKGKVWVDAVDIVPVSRERTTP